MGNFHELIVWQKAHRPCARCVSCKLSVSPTRVIRTHRADATGERINSGQHCGRLWARWWSRIGTVSSNCFGIGERTWIPSFARARACLLQWSQLCGCEPRYGRSQTHVAPACRTT